ncbi:MAG: hypothetical protein KIT31_39035 [Deltaproteobacteria bacterium]|nr:hypothetical protein [Deltaproteobacteria bacterium]
MGRASHATGATPVLGFAALQLSIDRDPDAPHAERPAPGSLDLASLLATGELAGYTGSIAPRIEGSPVERAALGYLHANCGGCHRADGPVAAVGLDLTDPAAARRTAIGRPSDFGAPKRRVAPGAPADSVLLARMRALDPLSRMPPLGTRVVDDAATHLIASWIDQLADNQHLETRR